MKQTVHKGEAPVRAGGLLAGNPAPWDNKVMNVVFNSQGCICSSP